METGLLRSLLDALPEGLIATDGSGRIVYLNAEFERLLGWRLEELAGEPLGRVLAVSRPVGGEPEGEHASRDQVRGERRLADARGRDGQAVALEVRVQPWPMRSLAGSGPEEGSLLFLSERRPTERWSDLSRGLRSTVETAARLDSHDEPTRWAESVVQSMVTDFDATLAGLWVIPAAGTRPVLFGLAGSEAVASGERRPLGDPGHPIWSNCRLAEVLRTRTVQIEPGIVELESEGSRGQGAAAFAPAFASLPMIRGGELMGVLVYMSRHVLSEEFIATLKAFTAVVTAALSDRQLYERARLARHEAEGQHRKLQTILDVLPIGVMLLEGPEGRVTLVNPAAQAMGGTASVVSADVLGELNSVMPVYHLDGRIYQLSERPLWRALFRGERVRETLKYVQSEGKEVFVEVSAAPFPGPEGGAVAGFRDVSEEVQLRYEQAERAAQFKALLDHLPVGVAYFDERGVCRAANGPARRFLRKLRGATLGASSTELFGHAPALHDALGRCLIEHTPHVEHSSPWFDFHRTEEPRYLDWRFEPLNLTQGRHIGALALIVDVTERKLAADQLRAAAEVAEQASHYKSQFLSAVSHDLRTPVNALSLLADWLGVVVERQAVADQELPALVADLKQSTSSLVDLVNDLLELTLFDSGDLSYHPIDFAIGPWLEEMLKPLRLAARAKGLELYWGCEGGELVVRTDRVKLGRVLVNLAGNAIKFAERGQVSVSVALNAEDELVLSVSDTGPGIPQDQLSRIFDEFAQLRNPQRDRTKGTGLGLAICRRLVEGAGGRILVQSVIEKGSTFTAIYPESRPSGEGSGRVRAPGLPAVLFEAGSDRSRILIVEDDPFSRRSLARLLEREGYEVLEAETGPEALERVERQRPSLVLLDLMLPGMDGADVLRLIRRGFDGLILPVVVLSGDLLSDRIDRLRELDVNGILAKPIEFPELLAVVRGCLEAQREAAH